jgi:hypothetical protein
LLAIGTGKKSIEETRANTRKRVARHRANKAGAPVAPVAPVALAPVAPTLSVTVTDDMVAPPCPGEQEDDLATSAARRKQEYVAAEEVADEDTVAQANEIRELVLEEYFSLASGDNILKRIRAAKRNDVVITDFLDALGVPALLKAMSLKFGAELRSRVPKAKLVVASDSESCTPSSPATDDLTIPTFLRRGPA